METTDDIKKVLQQPHLLEQVPLDTVEAWTRQYPYYDIAHLLLLKKYQLTDMALYEEYLPVAAMHAASRTQLQYLMQHPEAWVQTISEAAATMTLPTPESSNPEKPADEVSTQAAEAVESSPVIEETDVSAPQGDNQYSIDNEAAVPPVEQHSFVGWLQQLQQKPPVADTATEEAANKQEIPDIPESPIDAAAYMEAMWQKEFSAFSTPDLSGLGKGSVAKKDLDDAELRAKKSVEMGDELVTETLAHIYSLQGNHERAIATYEKLRLKYPEKSNYFAAKIAALQQKRL